MLLIPDNLLLASAVDGVVLVAKAGSTGFRDLARAKTLLEGAGARMLGVVLNQVPVGAAAEVLPRLLRLLRQDGAEVAPRSGRGCRRPG